MTRHRLTDEQWALISDLFSPPQSTGRPPRDRRDIMDGILWILHTGAPWRDLPEVFGPWATVWDLFDTWNADGTLEKILVRLRQAHAIDSELWCIDGSVVRAARCASGGGKKGLDTNRKTTPWAAVGAVLVAKSTFFVIDSAVRFMCI